MNPTRLRSLFRPSARISWLEKLNLWAIEDEVAIGVDLQMSALFELSGLPDLSLEEVSALESYFQAAKRLLHSQPEKVSLQFVIQSRNGDAQKLARFAEEMGASQRGTTLEGEIVRSEVEWFAAKSTSHRRHFLFLTTRVPTTDVHGRRSRVPFCRHAPPASQPAAHEARVKELADLSRDLADSLSAAGAKARRLASKEIGQFIFERLNPHTAESVQCPDVDRKSRAGGRLTARSTLALSACQHHYDHFLIDGIYHRALNLLLLPEATAFADLSRLAAAISVDHDLILTVHCVDSEQMLARLKSSANVARALSASALSSRYEAEQKYIELDELIREIRGTTQKLFTFSLALLLKAPNVKLLDAATQTGLKEFQRMGAAVAIADHLNHENLFLSALPNHSHLNQRKHVIQTNAIAKWLPLSAPWTGCAAPKILFDRPDRTLVGLDLFDPALPSKHALLVGSTGSGKSFATNYLLTHFFIESILNHIVVIDIGGSYRKLCEIFGGRYLRVEASDQFAINPFPQKEDLWDGKVFDEDALAYLTLVLERMVGDDQERFSPFAESLLEGALRRAYLGKREGESPTLAEVRRELGREEGGAEAQMLARKFVNGLHLWTEGRYGRFFSGSARMNTDSRLVVFDLEALEAHPRLQSVYFYIVRELIDAKLRDKSLRKMIVVDEGWRFFNDEIGSRLIESLYRTARKSNGMILSISQSPLDFLNTKAANAIISNTYVRYALKLTKGHETLSQFGFNSREVEAIRGLESVPRRYSDLFARFGERSSVLRIEPSPLDYWICTTDAEDAVKESRLKELHPDWTAWEILRALGGPL